MKNIHLIPTDKPSRLFTSDSVLILAGYPATTFKTGKNIYITSDEEIKEPCWCWDILQKKIYWVRDTLPKYPTIGNYFKKIILTTDQELIADGVQDINDEFLNWYVNNLGCEKVEIEDSCLEVRPCDCVMNENCLKPGYKIIIPKAEIKQENCCTPIGQIKRYIDCKGCGKKPKQETLEEESEREASLFYEKGSLDWNKYRQVFIEGAKWQQNRSYGEEEVLELLLKMNEWPTTFDSEEEVKEWFEQFKK